jgi:hypothetical protein
MATINTGTATPGTSQIATTLLDVPVKIRERIYYDLLDLPVNKTSSSGRSYWHPTTAFLTTCHQVYDEASAVLFEHHSWTLKAHSKSTISFAPSSVRPQEKNVLDRSVNTFASAVNKAKHLKVEVDVWYWTDICETQEALFVFFDALKPHHSLHHLEVQVDIVEPVSSAEDEDHDPRYTRIREFSEIRPGSYDSRPHTTAFLTDPLRNIRLKPDGKKKGKFSLTFPGHTSKPWSELTKQLRGLLQGQSAPRDYKAFVRYYAIRRELEAELEDGLLYHYQNKFGFFDEDDGYDSDDFFYGRRRRRGEKKEDIDYGFDAANRRADVAAFRKSHRRYIQSLSRDIHKTFDWPMLSISVTSRAGDLLDVVESFKEKFAAVLPPHGTNTDYYGFKILRGEVDAWLRWGKEQAKADKKERKRKRAVMEEGWTRD